MRQKLSTIFLEFICAACNADATEMIILTDAPRFEQISVRDNGRGFSTELIVDLTKHFGIGRLSAVELAKHFLVITKVEKESHRTVMEIVLKSNSCGTEHARVWRERASGLDSHGTEIIVLELFPRARAELASNDLWAMSAETERTKPQPGTLVE